MRRILLSTICVISLFTMGSAAPDKPDFQSLYQGYEDAVRQMNVDQYMGFFADDITIESPQGQTLDKPALIEAQRESAGTMRVNGFQVQVVSVSQLDNGDYDVVVRQDFDRDQEVAAGTKFNLHNSVVRRETWHQTRAGWKIVELEDLVESPIAVRVKAWL